MNSTLLDAALEQASKGIPVFPCRPDTKAPYVSGGYKSATTDDAQIRQWWGEHPQAMIGMPTGTASGIFVLDIDVPKKEGDVNGEESLRLLEEKYGELPSTRTQRSGGGGRHHFFTMPEGTDIRNSASALAPGIDIRGTGGHIILAPSTNSTGGQYTITNQAEPVPAPEWLLELICEPARKGNAPALSPVQDTGIPEAVQSYVRQCIHEPLKALAETTEGSRNDTLNRTAFILGRWVGGGHLDENEARQKLFDCAEKNGLAGEGEDAVHATITSGLEAGKQQPRHPPASCYDTLPSGFYLRPTGLYYRASEDDTNGIRLGSLIDVLGMSRDVTGTTWGLLLEWHDADNNRHTLVIPIAELAGDAPVWLSRLLDAGWRCATGRKAKEQIARYLMQYKTTRRVLSVSSTGWHNNVYVFPDTVIGQPEGEQVCLVPTPQHDPYQKAGTLQGWQGGIGLMARGNSRLVMAICAALAAPLLKLMNQESGGFNFVGVSSIGKTTTLLAAASVWGKGSSSDGFINTWRATDNGLEGLAAMHSDSLLCLDEVGQASGKILAEAAYMLANGKGKTRSTRSGNTRQAITWRTMVISTGEIGLADKLREEGKQVKAGQEVRLVDIPADAGKGLGLFEDLHGYDTAQLFADAIRKAAVENYGHLAPAFITRLVENDGKILAGLEKAIETIMNDWCDPDSDGQVKRVTQRFLLCALAGEIATGWGLLPWERGEALAGVKACVDDWLANRGGAGAAEDRMILHTINLFIKQHGASRFQDLNDMNATCHNRAGFRQTMQGKTVHYWFFAEVFAEVLAGHDVKRAARVLRDAGILIPDGSHLTCKLPKSVPGFERQRFHRICLGSNQPDEKQE